MTNYQLSLLSQAVESNLDPKRVARADALKDLIRDGYLDQDLKVTELGREQYRVHVDGE